MKPSNYKHIIWDWNGTLLDDAWLCVEIMNGGLLRRGLPPLTLERYQEIFDFPVIDYYRRLGYDFTRETFEAAGTEFIVEYEKRKVECRLQPAAAETLGAIRDAGIAQSVLSAYKQDSLDEIISHFGLRGCFAKLVGLQDHYASGKIENGRRWIAETGHEPREVLLVGDTVHDCEVARAMGTDCILIHCGHNSLPRLQACGAPVLKTLSELLEDH
jgi:phosphoglycolate phosphatase